MSFRNKKKQKFNRAKSYQKLETLREARDLLDQGLFFDALRCLTEAVRNYPSEIRFWEMLAAVSTELDDVPVMQASFSRLTQLRPAIPDAWLGLAIAYGRSSRLALSYLGFQDFLKKFPDDENAAEATALLEMAEENLRSNLADLHFPDGDAGLELACLHEETQILLEQRKYDEGREKAEKLISLMPDFTPAYNNLSLNLFMDGQAEKAVDAARATLVKHATNCHALANLVHFSMFLGRQDEAQNYANRLRVIESDLPDVWIKKLEAFTFMADHQAVIETHQHASRNPGIGGLDNFGKHLAAYAFFQSGKEKEARKLWRKIIRDDPNFDLALENLEETLLPENERNVYAFPLYYWVPQHYMSELRKETGRLNDGQLFEKNLNKKLGRFLEKNPGILNVLPMVLERGDIAAQEFARGLMLQSATPESFAALKEFAFGQKGTDQMRYKVAMALAEAEVIPKNVRLWAGGEWREMRLLMFEVTGEPVVTYPMKPKAEQAHIKGIEAMQRRNLDVAEQYFKMALMNNGADHPSILYNMLMIEELRGRAAGAEKKLRDLVERFPDYSFAAISLAKIELKKGKLDAARNLTEKLHEKKKWHLTEISPWLFFNIELALAENQFDSARMSLDMLRQFDENVDYEHVARVITRRELLYKVPAMRSKRKRRINGTPSGFV